MVMGGGLASMGKRVKTLSLASCFRCAHSFSSADYESCESQWGRPSWAGRSWDKKERVDD